MVYWCHGDTTYRVNGGVPIAPSTALTNSVDNGVALGEKTLRCDLWRRNWRNRIYRVQLASGELAVANPIQNLKEFKKRDHLQKMLRSKRFYFCVALRVCVCLADASEERGDLNYFDAKRASGIWAFNLGVTAKPSFVTDPIERTARLISADKPYVKGLAPRFFWKTIEPEEGKYNWAPIDRLFEIAESYDKLVVLRFIGGANRKRSPDWLWNHVTHYVDRTTKWKEEARVPYLGDPVFQKYWDGFIAAVGKRYEAYPRLQRVAMSSGLDQEMYYTKKNMTQEEIKKLSPKGGSETAYDLKQSWHQTFLTYKEAFPNKAVTIDLSEPLKGVNGIDSHKVMTDIVKDASAIFGGRLYIQQDGLSERNAGGGEVKKSKSIRALMLQLSTKHLLGFETLLAPQTRGSGMTAPAEVYYHDLRRTIDVGLSFPIYYIEAFTESLNDPSTANDFKYLEQELEKRARQR